MTNTPEFFRLQGRTTLFMVTRRWAMAGDTIPVVTGRTIHNTQETTARLADVTFLPRAEAYESAIAYKYRLESDTADASRLLKSIPGVGERIQAGVMGLTADHVKASAVYKAAKKEYTTAFNMLRDYNEAFLKLFKDEYRDARREKE